MLAARIRSARSFASRVAIAGLVTATLVGNQGTADAAVVYDESVSGDFSGDNFAPTMVNLLGPGPGGTASSSTVIGNTQSGSADIFTVQVAANTVLESLFLDSYTDGDANMFVAIEDADTFPNSFNEINFDPFFNGSGSWLGGAVIGVSNVGSDVLPNLGAGFVGQGFSAPLGEGDYTFLVQQTGPPNGYELTFNVTSVPEPGSMMAIAGGLGLVVAGRRRRKKSVSAQRTTC